VAAAASTIVPGAVIGALVPLAIGPDDDDLLVIPESTLGDLGSAVGGSSPLPRLSYEASKATL
jgi:hypothetical protein